MTNIMKNDELKKLIQENKKLVKKLSNEKKHNLELQRRINELVVYKGMYESISNSHVWKITKPLRYTIDVLKFILNPLNIKKGFSNVKKHGFVDTFSRMKYIVLGGQPQLPNNTLIHVDNRGYHSFYMDDIIYRGESSVRILCFYLPQFHTFYENDIWWGKGFTEWTNTKKARPLYDGHYQPREPHSDIGYYDLSILESLKKQVKLAKEHGIFGFCIYYYWFSGKILMDKPINLLLENKDIVINFCLCWANENWTRTWDGAENDILIKQDYSDNDPQNFIHDIKKFMMDKRYIRMDGKPVIVVYNPSQIKNCKDVFKTWKEEALKQDIGDISIWICKSFDNDIDSLGLGDLVDRQIEFPPHNLCSQEILESVPNIKGNVYDYSKLVDEILIEREDEYPDSFTYRTVMLGWDNSPRRREGFNSFDNFDLRKYYKWLSANINETKQFNNDKEQYTFINAWNEWGEGTYLEPDKKYGYSCLNTTTKALYDIPFELYKWHVSHSSDRSRIAVQVHMFYDDLAEEIIDYINNIPEYFDCYITTDNTQKADRIYDCFTCKCKARKIVIYLVPNIGRDVGPFLYQMKHIALDYDYICHIHTKRSKHSDFGDKWRQYLLNNLLGSEEYVKKIVKDFDDDSNLGLVYPEYFASIKSAVEWGTNKIYAYELLNKISCNASVEDSIDFPAGNMFWIRTCAVKEMFDYDWNWDDFPNECGQLDGTIMHAVERCWNIIAKNNGYNFQVSMCE